MVRGKTTLFKVICNELSYDSGDIFVNKSTKIGYVEQFTLKNSNLNVLDELITIKQNLLDIEKEIELLQSKIEAISSNLRISDTINSINGNDIGQLDVEKVQLDELILRKHNLEVEYENNGGYTYKSIARSTLIGLRF